MKYFYTNLFVVDSKDYDEISRALDGITFYKYDLAVKEKSAILVIASVDDSDKALKVLRGFNANPFSIPEGIPQIPAQAYSMAETKIKELTAKQSTLSIGLVRYDCPSGCLLFAWRSPPLFLSRYYPNQSLRF